MKKLVLIISGLLVTVSSFALSPEIAPAEKSFMDDPFNHPMLPYYLVFAFLLVSVVLVAYVGIYVLRIVNILSEQVEKEKAQGLGAAYVPTPGWWARFSQRMNASVPVKLEKNIEMDHNYDGIKELDNHLPPWWKWLFYGTIGWAAVYLVVFHFSDSLPLSIEEYQIEVAQAEDQARQRKVGQPEAIIDENNLTYTAEAAIIEKGKAVFANNPCGSCHGNEGGGNIVGPNLTDEYWIHGGDIKNIFKTIKEGVTDKGMPSWGKSLSPQDVRDVTFYILSLQGSKPPNPKAPQGELFKQTIPVKSDSTKAQASL